jgi:hypothetical protein
MLGINLYEIILGLAFATVVIYFFSVLDKGSNVAMTARFNEVNKTFRHEKC